MASNRKLNILIYVNTGVDLRERKFDERMANACTLYRAINPSLYSKHNIRILDKIITNVEKNISEQKVVSVGIDITDIKWADIIVFQRHFTQVPIVGGAAEVAMRMGKTVVYETDDYIHKANQLMKVAFHEMPKIFKNIKFVDWFLPLTDGMFVTTNDLADAYKDVLKDGAGMFVLPNSLDLNRWKLPVKKHTANGKEGVVRIGWQGSWSHMYDFAETELLSALKVIKKEYGDKVDICFFTNLTKVKIDFKKAKFYKPVPLIRYPKRLHSLDFDIGLAPLRDTEFNRAKSNIKYLEYGILGIPTIASMVTPYMEDKVVLVKNRHNDWYKAIKKLIEDPDARERIGLAAREDALQNYDIKNNYKLWDQAYEKLAKTKGIILSR